MPVIPDISTGETTSKLVRHNNSHKKQFDITKEFGDNLKQQILAAFHNDYVEGVANATFGFTHTTTLELLNHLYNSYVAINPREMENATNTMVSQYLSSQAHHKAIYPNLEDGTNI